MTTSTSELILILAPAANDGAVAVQVLAGALLTGYVCKDVFDLRDRIQMGCGAVVISEEALTSDARAVIEKILDCQEPWSDLPIILLVSSAKVKNIELLKSRNVSILERPLARYTFIRSVEVALISRRRQYQVRNLLADLRKAKDAADHANLTKTQFLANMSHEIRTPIGAIIGFSDLMKNPANTAEESRKYMGIVERNSLHLLRLIDDILDLSKVEAGKMTIERLRFRLTDFLVEFNSVMSRKAAEKHIRFSVILDTEIPEFACTDPVRLRQVLSNIVGNALKFTERGYVEMRVAFQDPFLLFQVADSGIGLSPQQAANLFKPFAQADSSTTRKFGGTGLGLVLSRHLAEALGGSLTLLRSEEGLGSTFEIRIQSLHSDDNLTLVGKDALDLNESELLKHSAEQKLRGMKILLVEDSVDNQLLISTYLKKSGASVTAAGDGRIGIQKALSESFDVVLMDIQMPTMDGHEAARSLRRSQFDRPIIALTAHAMKEERLKCFESGFTDFLTKPIQAGHLIELISRYQNRV